MLSCYRYMFCLLFTAELLMRFIASGAAKQKLFLKGVK